jgi:hypothetical protein
MRKHTATWGVASDAGYFLNIFLSYFYHCYNFALNKNEYLKP